MIVQKERINESESYIFVKWLCTNKITNERERESHIFLLNGYVQIKEINQRVPSFYRTLNNY